MPWKPKTIVTCFIAIVALLWQPQYPQGLPVTERWMLIDQGPITSVSSSLQWEQ